MGLATSEMTEVVGKNCPQIIAPMSINLLLRIYMFLDSLMTAQTVECTGKPPEPQPRSEAF
jgi:hypothetical protein